MSGADRNSPSPYERGFASAAAGEAGPPFPKGDASWTEKLFNRGWSDGVSARAAITKSEAGRG